MKSHARPVAETFRARPARIRAELEELSRNLWWTWSTEARDLWGRVADLFPEEERGRLLKNPILLVRALRPAHLKALADDPRYVLRHTMVRELFLHSACDGAVAPGFRGDAPVAYFSMEFAVHDSLAIYAGGLGILAGDHLKSASDEGLPTVGVGLYYHKGYYRQELDLKGRHRVVYPLARPADLPMNIVRTRSGRELRIPVELPDHEVSLRVWRVDVGRTPLYLLDADVAENRAADRRRSHRLYSNDREERIQQELFIGIGGVRLLRALGIRPSVWHLNEGHVAFLTLERLREVRASGRVPLGKALEQVASNTVFTTHTPVPEGNEEFEPDLAARYLERHAKAAGIPVGEYLDLGRHASASGGKKLSMTVLAIRLSRFRNGVSRLHGEVARRMWKGLWPKRKVRDIPITSVTNGVHTATWTSPEFDDLFTWYVDVDWAARPGDPSMWRGLRRVPERELWDLKRRLKAGLIEHVRAREAARLDRLGVPRARIEAAVAGLLDPDALTIGFARRFALYKRAPLIFHDLAKARRIFSDRRRPVQILFAGKPHPEDRAGQALFERVAEMSRRPEFRGRVVILEGYDIDLARHLVRGVDVWLNNPRRPQEASGTSGQKVPINGGINVSVLDGWWDEASSPRTGWAFGTTEEGLGEKRQDDLDAEGLYRVLEREVIPLYFRRDAAGVPIEWFRKVKASMEVLIPRFSTSRMVLEYARKLYLPAMGRARTAAARRKGRKAR